MDSYTMHLRHGKKVMRLNNEAVEPVGHATDIFTTWACGYIRDRSRSGQPFFLYLAYNAPHFPIEPPPEWLEKVRKREPGMEEKRALNVALVEHLDSGIGRVLGALKEAGVEDNMLVFLTSDNGGYLPVAANNDPWRGGKTDFYDGGLKVPFMVRWPGKVAAGSRSDYEGLVFDIFATSLEAAGRSVPADCDAVSLGPVLRGEPALMPRARELYFALRQGGPIYGGKTYEAIVCDGWKLMQNNPYLPLELYNLADDPQEKTNLIDREPKIAAQLKAALRAHIQQGGATPWQPPRLKSEALPVSAGTAANDTPRKEHRARSTK
jgi:arylsulfatase A-like enzyme